MNQQIWAVVEKLDRLENGSARTEDKQAQSLAI